MLRCHEAKGRLCSSLSVVGPQTAASGADLETSWIMQLPWERFPWGYAQYSTLQGSVRYLWLSKVDPRHGVYCRPDVQYLMPPVISFLFTCCFNFHIDFYARTPSHGSRPVEGATHREPRVHFANNVRVDPRPEVSTWHRGLSTCDLEVISPRRRSTRMATMSSCLCEPHSRP